MYRFIITTLLLSCLCTTASAETNNDSIAPPTRPNILFIAIDDLRPELGIYGAPQVKTPNIDQFASQGLTFHRAYAQVPTCGASRSSLMSGVLPTSNRFVSFKARADKDAPNARTLPQVFKEAGYTTLSNGKVFHEVEDSQDQSWSEPAWRYDPLPGLKSLDPETTRHLAKSGRGRIYEHPDVADDAYTDGQTALKAIQDLGRLKESQQPFFLAVGFVRPHMPFYAPKKYWDLYDREEIELALNQERPEAAPKSLNGSGEYKQYHLAGIEVGTPEWHRMMRHGYYASVSYVDKLVGDVLAELERLNLADNTIVVIWGDHGWHLGEHNFWGKHNTLNTALRVPLIIKVPGKVSGKSTTALVESVDIFPTLTALADLSTPNTVQGASFDTLFTNPQQPFRDFTYSRFKSADTVATAQYIYTLYENGEEMLYGLEKDPDENKNVAGDPLYSDIKKDMRKKLDKRINTAVALAF